MTSDDAKPGGGSRKPDHKAGRAARLEEELRANLRRRKDQARLRSDAARTDRTPPIPGDAPDAADPD